MYINLMKEKGFNKTAFEEMRAMAKLEEVYSNKGEGANRAINLANETLFYPIEDAGRINYIYEENSSMAYQKVLDQLTPDNMMVFLIAKGLKTDKKEYFYQAPYSYMEDEKFYKELINLTQEKDLVMREPNPFIPKLASLPDREIDLNNF